MMTAIKVVILAFRRALTSGTHCFGVATVAFLCGLTVFMADRTRLFAQASTADSVKYGPLDEWVEIRARVLPVRFFIHEKQFKLNLESLLVELLDEKRFPDNPLKVDPDQKRRLAEILAARHDSIQSQGVDLKASVEAMKARGAVAARELDRFLPGINVYQEHATTVRQLKGVLNASQIQTWRDMAILQVHLEMRSFREMANRMVGNLRNHPAEQIVTEPILRTGALEDFRLSIETYLLLARSFDRVVSILPRTEREKLDRLMKVDVWQ